MVKLKPCPFCEAEEYDGSGLIDNHIVYFVWRFKIHYVECRNIRCNVQPKTLPCLSRKEAFEAWNTRSII